MRGSLESAIDELVARFGFEARPLVLEVVLLIAAFPGGVDGFIDKFRAAGLGSEVTSWLGRSDAAVLMGPQVERALQYRTWRDREPGRPGEWRRRRRHRQYATESDRYSHTRRVSWESGRDNPFRNYHVSTCVCKQVQRKFYGKKRCQNGADAPDWD